ncbi:MAG TPA: SusD/RagB family nutrient-binding outer membrane lipoprotein, partial [Sphingobacteriaceae bacterium]
MKKLLIKIKSGMFLIAMVLVTSCEKTLDINESPNNPGIENATPEVLFPTAVISTAAGTGGQLAAVGGIWAQFYTQSATASQFRQAEAYNLTNVDEEFNLSYEELYTGALNDYQLAIQKSQERGDWRYNLMATVMKAYTFAFLVDLYDKIPYSQALHGQAKIQPAFDDGYTVYVALLAEIDAALAKDFSSSPLSAAQKITDFVFNGDMDKWERFANTLKLKMYLRMVNAKPAEAEAGIKSLYSAGAKFLTTNAGVSTFPGSPDRSNPFYEFNVRRLNVTTNIRASYTFTSWLGVNNDPRVSFYFGTTNPISIHQGDYAAPTAAEPSYPNATVFVQSPTDPVWFITAAESYFMQAEALERYYGGTGAKAMYDAGVTAAFALVGMTPGTLLTGAYAYPTGGTFEQKLEAIIVQKWASLAAGSHAMEAFFEHNRTGYPRISPVYSKNAAYVAGQLVYSANGVTGAGNFPKRFLFPDYERSRNSNTPAEVPIT